MKNIKIIIIALLAMAMFYLEIKIKRKTIPIINITIHLEIPLQKLLQKNGFVQCIHKFDKANQDFVRFAKWI